MNKFPICPIFIPANKLTYVEKAIKSGERLAVSSRTSPW